MQHKLNFKFKGSRDYVHGSDIFNAVEQFFTAQSAHVVELAFRGFSRNHLVVVLRLDESSRNKVLAQGKFIRSDAGATPTSFWLVDSDEPVVGRYDFDEDSIIANAVLNENSVSLSAETEYTVIENVIALTKLLSYSLLPDVEGKWLFGQLKLHAALPPRAARIRIERRAVVGRKFTINVITLDDAVAGEIRFVVG